MNEEPDIPPNGRRPVDAAAESTHFRSHAISPDPDLVRDAGRGPESYHGSVKSIRMHAPRPMRAGLALKFAIPVIAAVLVGLFATSLLLRERIFSMLLNDLKMDAANAVFTTGLLGRLYLVHRDAFMAEHPEYVEREEWRAGDHWLVLHGFVGEQEWVEATGFELREFAPTPVLAKAERNAILGSMTRWINAPDGTGELVAASIADARGTKLAVSASSVFPVNLGALDNIPLPTEFREIDGCRIFVDYLPDIGPEPLVRSVAEIMRPDISGERIGVATVVLRTARLARAQNEFLLLALGLAALLTVCMTIVCWHAARRITVPLRALAEDLQAMAEGDYTRRSLPTDADELGQLGQAFNSMAERLRVARANEKENSRLESDLAIARDIQNNLLPPQTPRVRGLDIHTHYRPAREIGGDYFDFLPVDNQHMGINIADASGKSIPAALVMSTTRAILRFVAPGNASAAETLTRVNAILSVDIPRGMFVTAYYVILDPLNNTMLCASAGHTPLLIARSDGSVELVNPGGIALGFDGGPVFERSIREQRIKLERGDRVLLYTDGVVECVNPANEEYSDRRLREFLRRNRDLSSHDFVGALMADLDRHRGAADMRDDTTIVTFKVL